MYMHTLNVLRWLKENSMIAYMYTCLYTLILLFILCDMEKAPGKACKCCSDWVCVGGGI